ncbi:MAG: DUF502 domain-containing protein [Gemmatimonadota bacterium]|nr:DUF502 domain-containing protein [Gemmatimonadota bacterium]
MKRILSFFIRGLILTVPVAVTIWVCYGIFRRVDGWLGLPIPGIGFITTLALITMIGALGSSLLTRSAVTMFEDLLARLPFVRLLYTSTKDILSAFVGEKKRFSQPALVELGLGSEVQVLGFLTQASAERLGIDASVVVYVPHSYAWSGQMLILPSSRVKLLATDSAEFMAFIVSGGVTDYPKLH